LDAANRRSFRNRRVAQDVRAGFDSGDLPECVAAMAGERLERACSGKALQIVPVEARRGGRDPRTLPKQPVPTRGDNAFVPVFDSLARAENRVELRVHRGGFPECNPIRWPARPPTHFDAIAGASCTSCEGV